MRSRPGILIFSRRRQLLVMNRRALELTGQLNQTEIGQTEIGPVNDIRPASMHQLSAQIQKTLDHRREVDIWELFELKRTLFEAGRKIMVRGFGIADRNSSNDSRIVIVLEEVGPRQEPKLSRGRRRPSLLSAVPRSPKNQRDSDPKAAVSDAREWSPSPFLDRIREGSISQRRLE